MAEHESFYRYVEARGGVLDSTLMPPPMDRIHVAPKAITQQIVDGINKRPDFLWPVGNIAIEIVLNAGFNAFAHHDQGEEGIAIYAGLLGLLFELSGTPWSHSDFLKRTHPTKLKSGESQDIAAMIQRVLIGRAGKGPAGTAPTDEERSYRASNIAITAFCFICLHEIGHLVRAHIPYLGQKSGLQIHTLLENNNELAIAKCSAIQMLEVDADLYAARAIADFALTTWKMGRIFPQNFPIPRGDLPLYITDIFMGMALAFFCMDIGSRDGTLESETSHPVPAVRLGSAYVGIASRLNNPFGISHKESASLFLTALSEIKDFWDAVRLPARTFVHDVNEILGVSGRLLQSAFSLEAELRIPMDCRLRNFGTSAAHYDQFRSFYER